VIGTIIETISNLLIEKLNENIGLQQEQQLYDKYNSNFFEKKYNYVFIVLNTVAYEFIFISLLFWVNLIPPFGRSLDLINFWNHLTQSIFFIDYKIIIYILSIITFIYFQTEIVSNSANLYSYTKSILAIIIIIIYTIKKVDISIFFIITTILYIFIISVNIILLRKMELGRQIEDEIKSLINNN